MRELETPPTGMAGPDRLVTRRLVLLAVLPGVLIAAVAALLLWLVTADVIDQVVVLLAGAVLAAAVLVTAGALASSEARSVAARMAELWHMAAWARTAPAPAPTPAPAPRPEPPPRPRRAESLEQSEVYDHLARRLQSLVHREIGLLDELENQVEDPDLLKGIFRVDHLATRIRRYAENIAVLGGGVSDRMWTRPVSVNDVLRSAVAEIEQYRRVKLVPPVPGMLHGHAVVDVVHLLAELAENATVFSPPQTQVLVRAEYATAGLAVEIEDRGLGMDGAARAKMNALLATRDRPIPDDLVREGRIGLFVVATIAKQHGIAVQLQSNIFGGTQAVLVLPHELLADSPKPRPQPAEQPEQVRVPEPMPLPQRRRRTEPGGTPVPAGAVPDTAGVPAPVAATSGPVASPAPTVADRPAAAAPVTGPPVGAVSGVPAADVAVPAAPGGAAGDAGPGPAAARPEAGYPRPTDSRPALPTRNPQGHLPAELREPVREAGRLEDVEHSPGLMAAFQSGIRQAEDDHPRSEHHE